MKGRDRALKIIQLLVIVICTNYVDVLMLQSLGGGKLFYCIWGQSEINWVYFTKKIFESEVAICSDNGVGMFTRSELEDTCPVKTGCQFNEKIIYYLTSGYPKNAPIN